MRRPERAAAHQVAARRGRPRPSGCVSPPAPRHATAAGGSCRAAGPASSCRCPGGPQKRRWWPPAAATSSASPGERQAAHVGEVDEPRRRACRPGGVVGGDAGGSSRASGSSPFRHARSSPSVRAARTRTSPTRSASDAFATGTTTQSHRARASASTSASVPGRAAPSRRARARPAPRRRRARPRGALVGAEHAERDRELQSRTRLAHAAGREVHGDAALGPLESRRQHRGADALARSRTAASGRPTTWYAGRPDETWTSTVTGWPSTPMSVALRTAASTATSREHGGGGGPDRGDLDGTP